jgi:hypothetical protein
MGEVMVPEAGAQHDSTDERTFQKTPSRKTTAHRKPPFFSLLFSTTPPLYIMPCKKSMAEGLWPSLTFEMPFLVARGQGCGLKAGSAGGEDSMKDRLPPAERGGGGRAVMNEEFPAVLSVSDAISR